MTESLRTDLNEFLFSPIANDGYGLHLTMLSALARSGVDPWDEAARLAALSRESATQQIVHMLAGVPNGPPPGEQTASLAATLVELLHAAPNPRLKPVPSTRAMSRGEEAPLLPPATLRTRVKSAIYVLAVLVLVVIAYRTLGSS